MEPIVLLLLLLPLVMDDACIMNVLNRIGDNVCISVRSSNVGAARAAVAMGTVPTTTSVSFVVVEEEEDSEETER